MKTTEIYCHYCNEKVLIKTKYVKYKTKLGQNNFYCSKKCSHNDKKSREIEKICLYCKLPFLSTTYCDAPDCCSRSCAARYSQSFLDPKIISEKIKIAWENGCYKNIIYKLRKYKKCLVCGNRYYGNRKYCSLVCLKNSDVNNRISSTRKKMFSNGLLKLTGGTTKWIAYKDIKVQGSYEYRTCVLLDKWKKLNKIEKWEYTNDRFEYVGVDGKKHNYLLDFKVWNTNGSFYYIETKGFKKDNDELKWKSVRDKGFILQVWFGDDLTKEENNLTVFDIAQNK